LRGPWLYIVTAFCIVAGAAGSLFGYLGPERYAWINDSATVFAPDNHDDCDDRLFAMLTGPNIGGQMPHGYAQFRRDDGDDHDHDRLKVFVRSVNFPNNTELRVLVDGTFVGEFTLHGNGNGQAFFDPNFNITEGSVIEIKRGETLILSGTFTCGNGSPSPTATPSGSATATHTGTPTPSGTPSRTPTGAPSGTPTGTPSCSTTVVLSGNQEVPPNNSPGWGIGTVSLSPDQTMITVNLAFADLSSPAIAAHIHGPAAPGMTAPILFPFSGVPNDTSGSVHMQSFPITATQLEQLRAGLFYFNVHTTNFPAGEIRAQIVGDECVPTATPTGTPSGTPTGTASGTPTGTPSHSPTGTPSNSPTSTPTRTPTNSPTATATGTPSHSPTATGTPSHSPTATGTPSHTPTGTPSGTPTGSTTGTPTGSPTATATPTGSPTATPSPEVSRLFIAVLNGDHMAPPVTTLARGVAAVLLNENSTQIQVFAAFLNVTGGQSSASINCPALPGQNAAPALNLGVVGGTSGLLTGTFAVDAMQAAQLRAGLCYVVVGSDGFSGGDIRGQLTNRYLQRDFDGDGLADIALFRPSNGTWYTRNSSDDQFAAGQFGTAGDRPMAGDFDGDGKGDLAVFRNVNGYGMWYLQNSSDRSFIAQQWGLGDDIPMQGDFDGDGLSDLAVFRPSDGNWYVRNSSGGTLSVTHWGQAGDIAVAGDYDGDDTSDLAVYRPATGMWYVHNSSNGTTTARQWGMQGDIPVVGDFDADGQDDIAVFRPSDGNWYINGSNGADRSFHFGTAGDIPVAGRFDTDAKTDMAVFRPSDGNWYVLRSQTNTMTTTHFGLNGDIPIASY